MALAGDVEILITGKNALSPALQSATRDVRTFEAQNDKAMSAVERKMARMGGITGKFGSIYGGVMGAMVVGATYMASRAIIQFGKDSVDAFSKMDESQIRWSSIFTGRADEIIAKQKELVTNENLLTRAWEARKQATGAALAPIMSSLTGAAASIIAPSGFNPAAEKAAQMQTQQTAQLEQINLAVDANQKLLEVERQINDVKNGVTKPTQQELMNLYIKENEYKAALNAVSPLQLKALEMTIDLTLKHENALLKEAEAEKKAAEATAKLAASFSSLLAGMSSKAGGGYGVKGSTATSAVQTPTGGTAEPIRNAKGEIIGYDIRTAAGVGVSSKDLYGVSTGLGIAAGTGQTGGGGGGGRQGGKYYAQGGYVSRTGMYQLEAGESVVSRADNNSIGSINVSVNMQGSTDPHRLAIELKRELQTIIGT